MKKIVAITILFCFVAVAKAQNSTDSFKESYLGYEIEYKKNTKLKDFEYKALLDSANIKKYTLFFIKLPADGSFKNNYAILVSNDNIRKSAYFYPSETNKTSNLDTISLLAKKLIAINFNPEKDVIEADKNINSTILQQAQKRISNLVAKNYKEFALSIHPNKLNSKSYTEFGKELEATFNQSGINLKYLKGVPTIVSKIVDHNGQLECLMKWQLDIKADNRNDQLNWNILATSIDNGSNWFFTQFGNKQDLETMANDNFIKLNQIIISKLTLNNYN
ncbi:hypothetical protein [Flavobacterium sp. N2038]|uniref:hypothetical protein n=1 Tax=Flavobacterium sp. N2038 TaxID=2986829 RepID=UPI0022242D81|nr:hypothetical protein [Flavobacterium sp. N2038]